jgi:DNA-binding NtrC family response regulator
MNPVVVLKERIEANFVRNLSVDCKQIPGRPTLLIAAVDPEIRRSLSDLLRRLAINTIWAYGVEDVKRVLAKEEIAACLCGFWLQDGTYREVIRHVRRERTDVPVIIVSAPLCPQEYRDYLAAMNIGALDFLCHPYQQVELEEMLESAIAGYSPSTRRQVSVSSENCRDRFPDKGTV